MISGAHVVIYSKNAGADRAFFRDVLGFQSVDAGHGWLVFALPLAEAAFHPSDENGAHELYHMCQDLKAEIDRKSTRLNSSHSQISYAVFCLKKKKKKITTYSYKTHTLSMTHNPMTFYVQYPSSFPITVSLLVSMSPSRCPHIYTLLQYSPYT